MISQLEEKLITANKNEMISFLESKPEYFNEMLQLALSDKQPYSWRAAWLLNNCMENNDKRIKKYAKTILDSIKSKKDGHQRELIKILLKMDLKEIHEGFFFNICLDIWKQINKGSSVRFVALQSIVKLAKKHNELIEEIVFLTQDHYLESLSPGIKNSVRKIIKEL